MSNNYFWQGGRRISIEQTESNITLHAPNVETARSVADAAGVSLEGLEKVGPDLIRATVAGHRDHSMTQLRQLDNVVHHVYRTPGQPDSQYLITDSFFIKFKPETSGETINEFLQCEKLEVLQDLGQNTLQVRVTTATNRNAIKTANLAASREDVEYAEPNLVHQLQRFCFIPADELFSEQWHLHSPEDDEPDLVTGAGIFAPEAWEITIGSRDIVICVVDDGFDLTHPDFQGEDKIVGQLNAFESNGNVFYTDDVLPKGGDYHGTPCAGVALAEINGQGTVGVAPGCAFMAVRFPLTFDDAAMIQLFQRISREADVVSCSWGYGPGYQPLSRAFSDTLSTLARTGGRRGKGLVICVAAGNNNCPVKDINNTRTYEYINGFGSRGRYSGPIDRWIAAHPDVITVSGSTSLKTRSAYSSWGREICVCAPTNNFHDLQEFQPRGRGVVTTDNEDMGEGFTRRSRYTDRFGGTSSATPTVAGVCGLILSRNPNLTALQVKQLLQQTADKDLKIESETPVNEPGNFVDGFSLWFGHGKVNAARAVKAAVPETEIKIDRDIQAGLEIAEADSPIFSKVEISQDGVISDIRIGLDLTHTYIGDLRIDITAPDGTAVTLHDRKGFSTNDIRTVYAASELPALRAFIGKHIQGTWILSLVDTWRMDVGRLNSWRLIVKVTTTSS
ncbi:S8 family serine peptidase [Mastigocoleus sp. MO_188.B34]|uniref:S8 family serine peptidase n=1 Tax=Mastigocoleus sp. MO_188.B34 TaxID=3036635 RepID=UPI002623DECD|nr:S8 family serine peptidase [Mastigocoleus sp. MO_188.B34]MDJ0697692.1 S8 family serine peptidase [Mastigocoleus sp. MO_188.B34]